MGMICLRQLKVPIEKDSKDFINKTVCKKLKINESDLLDLTITKKSLDARKSSNIHYVYEVNVAVFDDDLVLKNNLSDDIFKVVDAPYKITEIGSEELKDRPIIVGSGPAGLFAGYLLAEYGYKPLIIERGSSIDERVQKVEKFWQDNILDINTNVQFGEGGAGTFSDGKLNTLIKDREKRGRKVFDIFVENGANEEIKYLHNPHIGTDALREIIKNIRNKIISMGGEFRFNTKLTNLVVEKDKLVQIQVDNRELIPCNTLILAIGHSARDTFFMLNNFNLGIRPKPFAIGVRIEHKQKLINDNQYGTLSNMLPPASYKLTYTTREGRGVYSFCMCPGGFVVNASSEEGHLAINGMSNYKRDEENANSALVVTILPKDFGNDAMAGISYQRKLEEAAYKAGHGLIPVQLYKDFKMNRTSTAFMDIIPNTKGSYRLSNLNDVLPSFVVEALKEAILVFDKKIKGFADDGVVLSAIESRTSSPITIPRDEELTSSVKGLYPCGEGSGYAGGITSAAIDGIKVAEAIIRKYKPFDR